VRSTSNDTEPGDLIRSVSRALRIMEEVSRSSRPLPVKVIARRCQLHVSTAYHLVRTLCYEGYLVRLPDGDYTAGSGLAECFHGVMNSLDRPPQARAVLRHLAATTRHDAYLACISGQRLVVVDLAEGDQSPWLEDLQPGLETAAHATAVGKALLATLPRRDRRTLLAEQGMRPFTSNTVTEPTEIETELAHLGPGKPVAEFGQYRDNVCCASVAVPGADPGTWWALGTTVRGLDMPAALLGELQCAANDITSGLSHQP
jgi:DNA-binding IclR family transcriptional regulator